MTPATTSTEELEAWGRLTVVFLGGGGALWITVKLLWRFYGIILARFDELLTKRDGDVKRLTDELEAERAAHAHTRARLAQLEADE